MSIRKIGLAKVVGSAVFYTIVFATVLRQGLGDPSHGGMFKLIAMALPGAFMLAGLIELITGAPFSNVSEAWDGLEGWQRGVLGLVVVVLAFVVMMAGIVIFA